MLFKYVKLMKIQNRYSKVTAHLLNKTKSVTLNVTKIIVLLAEIEISLLYYEKGHYSVTKIFIQTIDFALRVFYNLFIFKFVRMSQSYKKQ